MQAVIARGERSVPREVWEPIFQRSIDAYYEGHHSEGLSACEHLLSDPGVPGFVREATFQNQAFYARSLADLAPQLTMAPLSEPDERWMPEAASPCVLPDRVLVVAQVRGVADPLQPRAMLLELDLQLGRRTVQLLGNQPEHSPLLTQLHPVWSDDHVVIAGIVRDPREEKPNRAAVAELAGGELRNLRLALPMAYALAQGWAPVPTPAGLRYVTSWEPTEIWQEDAKPGTFSRSSLHLGPLLGGGFHAASPGVPIDGGYLFVVNEQITMRDDSVLTLSRFVTLDLDFHLTAVSGQWYLTARGQDRCTGLAMLGEDLIIGFATDNASASLARVPISEIQPLLRAVTIPGTR